ncbi:MAG: amidohydrolase, partial [Rhizobiaceae bacterium]|nr:amidohydrolase [Rhizobiaceae bacterium]
DGNRLPGHRTIDVVVATLRRAEAELADGDPLIAWSFDPIFLPTERLNRRHLDAVTARRPVVVIHSNFHLMTVNSAALSLVGYDRHTEAEGVVKDAHGEPHGELREMAAMFPIMRRLKIELKGAARQAESLRTFARMAVRAGVTTATDLMADLTDEDVLLLGEITSEEDFPFRLVAALNAMKDTPERTAERAGALKAMSADRLRLGAVKIMTDGSIQGYTARLKSPGYVTGAPNGVWNIAPTSLERLVDTLHASGVQMHIHVNGDEASETAIAALEKAIARAPRAGHRHTLQHCQMADEQQFRSMAGLGICANLFANHLWYFGDKHVSSTVGPERASRMNGARAALDSGVAVAIHSDAPVTPMAPLFTAWCAVNRLTPEGRILGEAQRISVPEALRAITMGAAYTLGLDAEIGSIEPGKRADFAVLDRDPLQVEPMALKDIAVLGTVSGGRVFAA